MGTILMNADINDIDENKLHLYNYDNLKSSETRQLVVDRSPEFRAKLVKVDLPRAVQNYINNVNSLTKEECLDIMENSSQLWDGVLTSHQYSLETLYKYADKLPLNYVDCQECLDVEFVSKYIGDMDVGDFVTRRYNRGDVEQFLGIAEIRRRYVRTKLDWKTSRESVIAFINKVSPQVTQETINEYFVKWFDREVSVETITTDYSDDERRSHGIEAVVNYFTRHRTQHTYPTWDAYVADCIRTGDTGLADVWWRDFFRDEILQMVDLK